MKIALFLNFIFIFCVNAIADSSLLLNDKEQVDLTSKIVVQKQLNLNNAFKVQLFGTWKSSKVSHDMTNSWVELVLNDEIDKALINYPLVVSKVPKDFKKVIKSTLPYLYWKKGLNHLFFNAWLELASNDDFLHTELGLALDHIVGYSAIDLLQSDGMVFTDSQIQKLIIIENIESKINFVLQAWKSQRMGEESIKWVNKLPQKSSLRINLLYTAITDYARKGKLALSGQLIKNAIEPYIEQSQSISEISHYYITLARLLYQAKAFDAANHYYSLIPEESKYYLQAQVEMSWSYIHQNNLSKAKAIVSSLNLDLFNDEFIPDAYLTSAIVNLKTCQFDLVQKDLNKFVKNNKRWAKLINQNLKKASPENISNNTYIDSHKKSAISLKKELEAFNKIFNNLNNKDPLFTTFETNVKNFFYEKNKANQDSLNLENTLLWQNKNKILSDAIYRMKFVRIEFLSQMRNLALNIPLSNTDSISTYNSAPQRQNEIKFPNDGLLWGDDIFHMSAEVKNLCLKGLK